VALHGVVGCVTSVIGGGKCGPGALSAAFSKAATPWTGQIRDPLAGTMVSAVIGGTASELGGGKFANGASTAAFGYLFNWLAHGRDLTRAEEQKIVDDAATWKDTPYASRGTALAGAGAVQGVGADCSGSTYKIYDQVGDTYKYKWTGEFAAAAAQEGFPFRQLSTNEVPQPGDVVLFKEHMAIYAGQDNSGNDLMWTARRAGKDYIEMPIKSWGSKPIGYYRYQVPDGG